MEKFRIAQYGLMQMVALSYGILCSGMLAKGAKYMIGQGLTLPATYKIALFYREYGIFLSLIIIGWAFFCAYHTTTFSKRNIDENQIVISGLILTGFFFLTSTFVLFWGIAALFVSRT